MGSMLVFYALSFDPFCWLYENTNVISSVPDEVWGTVYTPLFLAVDWIPGAEDLMGKWMELWVPIN